MKMSDYEPGSAEWWAAFDAETRAWNEAEARYARRTTYFAWGSVVVLFLVLLFRVYAALFLQNKELSAVKDIAAVELLQTGRRH